MSFHGYDCMAIQRAAYLTPTRRGWGLHLNWIGDIGGAKTSKHLDLCHEMGLYPEVVSLGTREPHDLLGMPIPQDNGFMRYYAPDFVHRVNEAGGAVIYLDEWNYASPSVQGACQRMLQEGYLGDVEIDAHVRCVMSMNPIDQAMGAGGSDISIALANRIGHLAWIEPNVNEWAAWLLADDSGEGEGANRGAMGNLAELEDGTLGRWPAEWAKARGLVATFLQRNTTLLKQVPKPNSPQASGAFPTARSWENATRAWASGAVHGLDEESKMAFASAYVGAEPINELCTWLQKNDLPDPEKVLDGEIPFVYDKKRLDRNMATLSACAALITPRGADKRIARAKMFWEIIEETSREAADIAYAPVHAVIRAEGQLGKVCRAARKVMANMHGVMAAARML